MTEMSVKSSEAVLQLGSAFGASDTLLRAANTPETDLYRDRSKPTCAGCDNGRRLTVTRGSLPTMPLIRFENYGRDRDAHEFRCDGNPSPIEPRLFDLLPYFVDNASGLVTKDSSARICRRRSRCHRHLRHEVCGGGR
jgi:DNA-binding response OmpR family regulator